MKPFDSSLSLNAYPLREEHVHQSNSFTSKIVKRGNQQEKGKDDVAEKNPELKKSFE